MIRTPLHLVLLGAAVKPLDPGVTHLFTQHEAPTVKPGLRVELTASVPHVGVYFEKYVKGKLGQTLWVRNLQLSIYGVPLAIAYSIVKDGK